MGFNHGLMGMNGNIWHNQPWLAGKSPINRGLSQGKSFVNGGINAMLMGYQWDTKEVNPIINYIYIHVCVDIDR